MTRPDDPWRDVTVLLIDGNNLLHAGAGGHGPGPLRGLLAGLGAAVPPRVDATVVLDGPPDPGGPFASRIRPGLLVRHAGRMGADALLVEIVESRPYFERAGVLVVTNDNALQDQVRKIGGRCRPVAWLESRLAFPPRAPTAPGSFRAGGAIAGARPERPAGDRPVPNGALSPDGAESREEDERQPWRPGRGATRKRGNPQRGRGRRRPG